MSLLKVGLEVLEINVYNVAESERAPPLKVKPVQTVYRAKARVRVVRTYIVEVGTELCFETMLEKCTIG